jgi:hypothetical protein
MIVDEMSMTVDGEKVCMRISNRWLNATEILKLLGKSKRQVKHTLDITGQHTEVQVEKVKRGTRCYKASWVCYGHGRVLCDAFELTDALRTLLECRRGTAMPEEVPQMNYWKKERMEVCFPSPPNSMNQCS